MFAPFIIVPRHPVLRLTALALICSGLIFASLVPYQSLIGLKVVGLGTSAYSGMLIAAALMSVILAVVMGVVSDQRGNRREVILAALALGFAGCLLVYFHPTPMVFLLAHVLMIPAARGVYSQLFAIVRQVTSQMPVQDGHQITGTIRAIFAFSWVAGPPALAMSIDAGFPVISVYLMAALAALLCFLCLSLLWPASAGDVLRSEPSAIGFVESLGEILRPSILGQMLAVSLLASVQQLFLILVGLLMTGPIHGTEKNVGEFVGLVALLEIPLMMMVARR